MRSTFKILFYINKNKTKADGTTAILCRITIDGANVVITTSESIGPHGWCVCEARRDNRQEDKPTPENLSGGNRTKVQYIALQIWSGECRTSEELLARHREKSDNTPCS